MFPHRLRAFVHRCLADITDPRKLARPLDHGGPVVAAHCGTCAFWDPENYYPQFVEMMDRYDNLYGDTAVMASVIRWNSLSRLSRETESLKSRIIHGSDYPFRPAGCLICSKPGCSHQSAGTRSTLTSASRRRSIWVRDTPGSCWG